VQAHDYRKFLGQSYGQLTVINVGKRLKRNDTSQGFRQYLVCRCTCGATKEIQYDHLTRSDGKGTRSCGCSKKSNLENLKKAWAADPRKHLAPEIAQRNRRFRQYAQNARHRGHYFDLTVDEFFSLESQPCHYCGEPPRPVNGIDRKDNSRGYTDSNCLPCCWPCNRAKGDQTYTEFMEWLRRVSAYRLQLT